MDIKTIIGEILLTLGAIGLVLGILGIFGEQIVTFSPWAMAILGFVFFRRNQPAEKGRLNHIQFNQKRHDPEFSRENIISC